MGTNTGEQQGAGSPGGRSGAAGTGGRRPPRSPKAVCPPGDLPPAGICTKKSRARPVGESTAGEKASDVLPAIHIKDALRGDLEGGDDRQAHKGKGHKGIDAAGDPHAVGGGLGLLQ